MPRGGDGGEGAVKKGVRVGAGREKRRERKAWGSRLRWHCGEVLLEGGSPLSSLSFLQGFVFSVARAEMNY